MEKKKSEEINSVNVSERTERRITDDEVRVEMENINLTYGDTFDGRLAKFHSANPARLERMVKRGTIAEKCVLPYLGLERQREYVRALLFGPSARKN